VTHDDLRERVERIAKRLDELIVGVAKITEIVQNLTNEVRRISETLSYGFEDMARAVVPGWLYRHEGIEVENLVRKFFTVRARTHISPLPGWRGRGPPSLPPRRRRPRRSRASWVVRRLRLHPHLPLFSPARWAHPLAGVPPTGAWSTRRPRRLSPRGTGFGGARAAL